MTITKITKNGEITFDTETDQYTVWDEGYSDPVLVTSFVSLARLALKEYADALTLGFPDPDASLRKARRVAFVKVYSELCRGFNMYVAESLYDNSFVYDMAGWADATGSYPEYRSARNPMDIHLTKLDRTENCKCASLKRAHHDIDKGRMYVCRVCGSSFTEDEAANKEIQT